MDYSFYWLILKHGSTYSIVSKQDMMQALSFSGTSACCSYTPNSTGTVWNLSFVGLDAPLVKQETINYCGPASVLQILKYFDVEGLIPGNGSTSQQKIASRVMNGNSGNLYQMRDELNSSVYAISPNYDDYHNMLTNASTFNGFVTNSLSNNEPVILLLDTEHLSYYFNTHFRHYICLVGYDATNDKYLLRDCNYYNTYFGEYLVTAQEIYNLQAGMLYILCTDND